MEEWRDVPGYEGLYQISISTKLGCCLSLERFITNNGTLVKKSSLVLSNHISKKDKRVYWGLSKNGKCITKQAAVWIALTYPELVQNEWFPGAEIDHIDTDRLNNHPSNLRWVNRKTNLNNPITKHHMSNGQKGHSNRAGKGRAVLQYKNEDLIKEYSTLSEAGICNGFSIGTIGDCCRGKRKQAYGYVWKYKREAV